jgi:hypothetical protein
MLSDHLDSLVHYKFIDENDRWPYGDQQFKKFVNEHPPLSE